MSEGAGRFLDRPTGDAGDELLRVQLRRLAFSFCFGGVGKAAGCCFGMFFHVVMVCVFCVAMLVAVCLFFSVSVCGLVMC